MFELLPRINRLVDSGRWIIDVSAGTIFSTFHRVNVGYTTKRGYVYSDLSRGGGKCKKTPNHRIIWVFANQREMPPELEINHIDGNKANNAISNLEAVSHNKNMDHSFNVLKNPRIADNGMCYQKGKFYCISDRFKLLLDSIEWTRQTAPTLVALGFGVKSTIYRYKKAMNK